MTRHVGVSAEFLEVPELKRASIFFDALAFPGLEQCLASSYLPDAQRADFEWLREVGLVFDPGIPDGTVDVDPDSAFWIESFLAEHRAFEVRRQRLSASMKEAFSTTEKLKRDINALKGKKISADAVRAYRTELTKHEDRVQSFGDEIDALADQVPRLHPLLNRAVSAVLNTDLGTNATVLDTQLGARGLFVSGKERIIQVIFHELPVPGETVAWEDILQLREDPETRLRLDRLRHWVNRTARLDASERELRDEIGELMHLYAEHMRLHKMKTSQTTLQILIRSSAEIIEDVTRLRFGSAAKRLFSLREQRVALLEAEMSAPGRDLAYILGVREKLG